MTRGWHCLLVSGLSAACTLTAPAREDLVGGSTGACGDGIVDAGEECDADDPHCAGCRHACTADEVGDPATRHCYQRFPPGGGCGSAGCLNWSDARAACLELPGRHLLVLNDAAEASYLASLIPIYSLAWTAGTDAGPGDIFHWDGFPETAFWPDNWEPGQPTGLQNEDCVVVNEEYRFEDDTCGGIQAYICEWHPPGTPP